MSTIDKEPEAIRYNAEITTLDHCPELLGRTALERLDILLRTNHSGIPTQPVSMMVETSWVEATTLPYRRNGKPMGSAPIQIAAGA